MGRSIAPPPPFVKDRLSLACVVAVLAACFAAFFVNLGGAGIFDLDEGLYSAAAREMLLRGDFVVPKVNNTPFFEKPPLAYWAGAASLALCGKNELAVRLPSALASSLTALLVLWLGTRLFGRKAGLYASLAYALSPLVLGEARQLTTDALLALWTTLALAALLLSMEGGGRAWVLFGAVCGLGILTKGIVALVLPVLALGVFRALYRPAPWPFGNPARLAGAVLLALLVALPWHLAAWQQGGEPFIQEYLVKQHIGRFRGGDTAHAAPFWFFVPGYLAGFFPWSFFSVGALLRLRRIAAGPDESGAPEDARRLLRVWFWTVFLFFSASGSKLVSYILPLYPAAALLVGDRLSHPGRRALSRPALAAAAVGGLLFGAVLFAGPIAQATRANAETMATVRTLQGPLAACLALAFAGCAAACVQAWRDRKLARPLAGGMLGFCLTAAVWLVPSIDRTFLRDFREAMRAANAAAAREGSSIVVAPTGMRRPSALFYVDDALLEQKRLAEEKANRVQGDLGSLLMVTDSPRALGEFVLFEAGKWRVLGRGGDR